MNIIEPNRSQNTHQHLGLRIVLSAILLGAITQILHVRADDVIPLPDVTEADGSMGMCYSFYELPGNPEPLAREAYAAGSHWDRFDFRWNAIESTPGVFNFAAHEDLVDRDQRYGIEVVAILGSTAQWASGACLNVAHRTQTSSAPPELPLFPEHMDEAVAWRACPPIHLDLPWDHPDNYWGRYVYQTVNHFKDTVKVWEIWNEPDRASFWVGSSSEYARLLQVGYQATKAADPEATVLFGGIAYWGNQSFYERVLQELQTLEGAAENNSYFDAFSLHLYSNVYQLGSIPAIIQAEMASTVGPHPIWLTETGVPIWGESQHPDPYVNAATAEEAAGFMIEGYAEARAAGVEKFFVFRTHDQAMDRAFGLIRDDRSLRPGYVAYQVAARYLHGENQITGPFSDGTVRRITFWGTPHGRIDVLWKETGDDPTQYQQSAVVPTATLIDHRGQHQSIDAAGGMYSVPLQPATANTRYDGGYIIGGPPVLLMQSDTETPSSTLRPLPGFVHTTTLTVTWDVTDTVSGYWYAQVEQAPSSDGPWTRVADWQNTRGITQTTVEIPLNQRTYFRSRARDNVGNWEPWPMTAEISTRAVLTRTAHVSLTTYLDENSNSRWDPEESPPMAPPHISWRSQDGDLITETYGTRWSVTQIVNTGDYVLETRLPHYLLNRTPLTVADEPPTQSFTITIGLKPIRSQTFLPLVTRRPTP